MSKYKLFIKCKSCREKNHINCSGRKNKDNFDDSIVEITCICKYCTLKQQTESSHDSMIWIPTSKASNIISRSEIQTIGI